MALALWEELGSAHWPRRGTGQAVPPNALWSGNSLF